jgi:hypothetical protein
VAWQHTSATFPAHCHSILIFALTALSQSDTAHSISRPTIAADFQWVAFMATSGGNLMAKNAAEHHTKAAEHHELAAQHHREAAKQHEAGKHETAAHHAHLARGHHEHAMHHAAEAAKVHVEQHSKASAARA